MLRTDAVWEKEKLIAMYKKEIGKGEFITDLNKYMVRNIEADSLGAEGRKIGDLAEYVDWHGYRDDGLTDSFQRGSLKLQMR